MIITRKFALLILTSLAFIANGLCDAGSCKAEDISVTQSPDGTGGIPKYSVEIVNNCVSGCAPRSIHFHCGWFSSTTLINPGVFRRLAYDDCLVNDGKPLENGAILSFYYSTTYMYPLSLKSASFC